MLVQACDGQNISVVFDLFHAKLLVELMRGLEINAHECAVKTVTKCGFPTTVLDSVVASGSFISIVGKYTDTMRPFKEDGVDKKEEIPDPPAPEGKKALVQ